MGILESAGMGNYSEDDSTTDDDDRKPMLGNVSPFISFYFIVSCKSIKNIILKLLLIAKEGRLERLDLAIRETKKRWVTTPRTYDRIEFIGIPRGFIGFVMEQRKLT